MWTVAEKAMVLGIWIVVLLVSLVGLLLAFSRLGRRTHRKPLIDIQVQYGNFRLRVTIR